MSEKTPPSNPDAPKKPSGRPNDHSSGRHGNETQELRLRHYENASELKFLTPEERYLFGKPTKRYKLNIIGTGTIGQEHMRVTEMEGRATVHGIFDVRSESTEVALNTFNQHAAHIPKVYNSLVEACMDPDIDGLVICTPNHTHLSVLEVAVQSGKTILLEKPMAPTLPEARKIAEIAQCYQAEHGAHIQLGLQYRYKSIYAESFYELLERRTLGCVKSIFMMEHRPPFLDKTLQWNKFEEKSGGTLVEKCCHYFDIMNQIAASTPVRVFATGSQAVNFLDFEYDGQKSDIIDNAFVTIDYENGINAGFSLNMFSPNFYEELTVCGGEGRLKAFETVSTFEDGSLKSEIEIKLGEQGISRTITPTYPLYIEKSGHSGATFVEHRIFVDKMDGMDTSAATVRDGLMSVLIGTAAEMSIKSGAPILIKDLIDAHKLQPYL